MIEIETKRLLLKEISWNDLNDIHRLHSIPKVDEFNTLGIPEDIEQTREVMCPFIEDQKTDRQKLYSLKINLKETGQFIGIAGIILSNDKFRLGEIFFKLDPLFWGRGYATEVSKALIKTGFERFNLHKVEAGVATANSASIRVLEKSGMTREGLRRKILPVRGEWIDNYHYAIVEDDPREY
ncbi:MAG: GNAT family N-acetyltransferase [Prolixibacteraceae bacterium]|nr:GNAT family N-acetyltransferase [Prolixibacteraceae bacterium]